MRLKAEIWVMAYVRRVNATGAMAMIVKRGDADAGAIYIKVMASGTPMGAPRQAALYGPAPSGFDEADRDRRWVCLLDATQSEEQADATLAQQHRFDADLWIVEVEDRAAGHFLDDWLLQEPKDRQ